MPQGATADAQVALFCTTDHRRQHTRAPAQNDAFTRAKAGTTGCHPAHSAVLAAFAAHAMLRSACCCSKHSAVYRHACYSTTDVQQPDHVHTIVPRNWALAPMRLQTGWPQVLQTAQNPGTMARRRCSASAAGIHTISGCGGLLKNPPHCSEEYPKTTRRRYRGMAACMRHAARQSSVQCRPRAQSAATAYGGVAVSVVIRAQLIRRPKQQRQP